MDIYILKEENKHKIDWNTFKEEEDYYISDVQEHNIRTGKYIKIHKGTLQVEFVNLDRTKYIWFSHNLLIKVPLLINI